MQSNTALSDGGSLGVDQFSSFALEASTVVHNYALLGGTVISFNLLLTSFVHLLSSCPLGTYRQQIGPFVRDLHAGPVMAFKSVLIQVLDRPDGIYDLHVDVAIVPL